MANKVERLCDVAAEASTTANDLARNLTCLLSWAAKRNHSEQENEFFIRGCYQTITRLMASIQNQYDDVSDAIGDLVQTDDIESYDDITVKTWFDHAAISDIVAEIIRSTGQNTWSRIAGQLFDAHDKARAGHTP